VTPAIARARILADIRAGVPVTDACHRHGYTVAAAYWWRTRDADFDAAWDHARAVARSLRDQERQAELLEVASDPDIGLGDAVRRCGVAWSTVHHWTRAYPDFGRRWHALRGAGPTLYRCYRRASVGERLLSVMASGATSAQACRACGVSRQWPRQQRRIRPAWYARYRALIESRTGNTGARPAVYGVGRDVGEVAA